MTDDLIKGFKDYIGEEAYKRAVVEQVIKSIFERYGFEPAETPVIEQEEFVRGENASDEAVSDIFKLQDKGKRKLALRYEFTFQLKRLMKNQKLPYKRFQIGPVFRDEPVSSARFRQFIQCDADIVGLSDNPSRDEAEVLAMVNEVLTRLGIKPVILINNRKLLNEIFEKEDVKGKNKEGALRELDKYDKLPESEVKKNLKKYNAEKIIDKIKQGEKYFKNFESYKEILELMKACRYYGLKVLFSPTIVRGLSYYNGTVFEARVQGFKESIVGGGAFNFNGVQSFGFGLGLDRVSMLSKLKIELDKILIVSLGEDKKAIEIAQSLRSQGKIVSIFYGKPTKALEYANAYKIKRVIFIGKKEVEKNVILVKDMNTGKQIMVKINKKISLR